MSYQKLADLVTKLHKKTIQGDIEWEETVKQGVYQAAFSNYSVRISPQDSTEQPDTVDYVIEIFDDEGKLLESFSDVDLRQFNNMADGVNYYKYMRDLHESARRMALGSEQAINSILSELDDDGLPF